jgi:hypothetical protein
VPAKVSATELDPDVQRARPRLARCGLQMVLRLLAFNAKAWLAEHFNAYLAEPGRVPGEPSPPAPLGGQIDYTTKTHHRHPRPTRQPTGGALEVLAAELKATPAHLPGDHRPLTYQVTAA